MFFDTEMEKQLEEKKLTPEQVAELKAKWKAEKEAMKEAKKEELKKQWEEEKQRRKEERDKVRLRRFFEEVGHGQKNRTLATTNYTDATISW